MMHVWGSKILILSYLNWLLGSIPEMADGKLYNTCTVFDPEGSMIAKYRKVFIGMMVTFLLINSGSLLSKR